MRTEMGTFLLFPFLHFPTTSLKCESKRDLHVPTLRSRSDTGEAGGREGEEATQPHLGGQREARAQSLVFDPSLDWLWSPVSSCSSG